MKIGVISIETLCHGLDGALERLLIARNKQNVGEIFVAVFEVLNESINVAVPARSFQLIICVHNIIYIFYA